MSFPETAQDLQAIRNGLIAEAFTDLETTARASIKECAQVYLDAGLPPEGLPRFLEPVIRAWRRQTEMCAAQIERILKRPRMN